MTEGLLFEIVRDAIESVRDAIESLEDVIFELEEALKRALNEEDTE